MCLQNILFKGRRAPCWHSKSSVSFTSGPWRRKERRGSANNRWGEQTAAVVVQPYAFLPSRVVETASMALWTNTGAPPSFGFWSWKCAEVSSPMWIVAGPMWPVAVRAWNKGFVMSWDCFVTGNIRSHFRFVCVMSISQVLLASPPWRRSFSNWGSTVWRFPRQLQTRNNPSFRVISMTHAHWSIFKYKFFQTPESLPFFEVIYLEDSQTTFCEPVNIFKRTKKSVQKLVYNTCHNIQSSACQPWTSASLNFHWFLCHKISLVHILAVPYNKTEFF